MKPLDPRLVRRSRAVRRYLAASIAVGVATAVVVVAQAALLAWLIARGFEGRSATAALLTGVALCFTARAGLAWVHALLSERASVAVKSGLRDEVAAAVLDPRRIGDRPESARVVSLLGPGLDALDPYFGKFLPQLVLTALVPATVVVAIATTDLVAAFTVAITLPLVVMFLVLVGKLTRDKVDRRYEALQRLGAHFGDVLDGLRVLKVHGRRQDRGLRKVGDQHRRESVKALRMAFLSSFTLELFSTICVALVAVSIGLRVVEGHMALGPGLFVLLLAPEAFLPVKQMGSHFHASQEGVAAAGDALDLLDHERASGTAAVPSVATAPVVLDAVGVTRQGRDVPVLAPVTATIEPGSFVALTGPSGSGKSTLLDVLLGFLRPTTGRVLVGGVDLATADPAAWRRQVAWVPQVPGLLRDTVAANVRLGARDASDDQVARALAGAGAPDLPLDRVLEDQGRDLSAGERRRVGIARALLAVRCGEARLVLMDEPTAGLDAAAEATVLRSLRDLGATVVVVAHHRDVVAAADTTIAVGGRQEVTVR